METINMIRKPFNYKDFSNLDESQDATFLIAAMGEMCELDSVKQIKQRAVKLMDIQSGEKVLDIGCGLGADTLLFAQLAGETGSVTGIDISQKVIDEARRRSKDSTITYQVGNANALDFDDNTFTACRADRLLLSQPHYEKVFSEAVRVLQPGGKLCISDLDHGSAIIYPYIPRLTEALTKRLQDIIENPFMGRMIPSLFRKYGFTDLIIAPEPYVVNDYEHIKKMVDFPRMIDDLYYFGIYTAEEAEIMQSCFEKANQKREFIYCVTIFTVLGRKPT